jgi:hypothetical protein
MYHSSYKLGLAGGLIWNLVDLKFILVQVEKNKKIKEFN